MRVDFGTEQIGRIFKKQEMYVIVTFTAEERHLITANNLLKYQIVSYEDMVGSINVGSVDVAAYLDGKVTLGVNRTELEAAVIKKRTIQQLEEFKEVFSQALDPGEDSYEI